jgi:hypothetical protein
MELSLLLTAGLLSTSLSAGIISPTSYNMRNGDGQTSGGTLNYWDKEYNGSGSTTTDASSLTGGLGNLTDGVIATQNWNAVENVAGTGPYVGWLSSNGLPVITFNFSSVVTFGSMTLYLDDSDNTGGVSLPLNASVQVGAFNNLFPIGDKPGAQPKAITLDLTGAQGIQLVLTLNYSTTWIFMSEVTFDGTTSAQVPEPASAAIAGCGLAALTFLARRRAR